MMNLIILLNLLYYQYYLEMALYFKKKLTCCREHKTIKKQESIIQRILHNIKTATWINTIFALTHRANLQNLRFMF